MRQFFKFMFASMLGTLLISVVLLVLFIGSLAALGSAFSMEGKPATVPSSSVLHISLDQPIVDRGPKDAFNFDFGPFKGASKLGLNDILDDIEKAKRDDRIKGVFLDLGVVPAGMATLKEIRNKLAEFKAESGKPIVAFADVYTQRTYYLASVADKVYLVPQGDLDFRGLQSEMMFMAGLFEKLGVDIQFIRGSDNRFKSFGETFTRKDMSPANKLQMTELLDGVWKNYINDVAPQRKLAPEMLDTIAAQMRVRKAEDAVGVGLVDSLLYRDQVLANLKATMGLDATKDIDFVELPKYTTAFVAEKGPAENSTSKWNLPRWRWCMPKARSRMATETTAPLVGPP